MTHRRTCFIKNKYLSLIGIQADLGYYIKTKNRLASEWRSPQWTSKYPTENGSNVEIKNIADVVEAIIGASFASECNFVSSIDVIDKL